MLISTLLLLAELNDTKRLYQEPWAESRAYVLVQVISDGFVIAVASA